MPTARAAFAFLCSVSYLLALPPPPAAAEQRGSRDGVRQVDYLLSRASSTARLDSQLYTPTVEDYDICPSAALSCFASEIKVLISEWNPTPKLHKTNLDVLLIGLANQVSQESGKTESECPQCESHREENATTFLRGLRRMLEYINSQ